MKKGLFFLLLLLMILLLSACGGKRMETTPSPVSTTETTTTTPKPTATPVTAPTAAPPPPTQAPVAKIEWSNKTYSITDRDGYTYEISLKMSPWILLSNTDIINAAWNDVGGKQSLPEYDDWGLDNGVRLSLPKGGITTAFYHTMNDMYYCVGAVQIKNTTKGWDITEDHPRSVAVQLTWESAYDKPDYAGAYVIGRSMFSSGPRDNSLGLFYSASMKKNTWGPLPFVIMAPENFAPKFPDGEHYTDMQNGSFYCENEAFNVGIIGKDGKYLASANQ